MIKKKIFVFIIICILAFTAFVAFLVVPLESVSTKDVYQLYYQVEKTEGKSAALAAVVDSLKQNPFVKDAGISESGSHVWIKYINGAGGGISFNRPGTKGGGDDERN